MNEATLPDSKLAHAYDPKTREHLGVVKVYLQPDGTYSLPDNTVECAPHDGLQLFQAFRLAPSGGAWEIVQDYRRVMLYDKQTGQATPNTLALGDALPDALTTAQPIALTPLHYQRNAWDERAGTWRTVPDYSGHPLWEKATGRRADFLPLGLALPVTLTTVAPPGGSEGRLRWDAVAGGWELLPEPEPESPAPAGT